MATPLNLYHAGNGLVFRTGIDKPCVGVRMCRCDAPAILGSVTPPDIPSFDLMHPTQVASPFHSSGWVYEEKYDGWRMLAYKRGHQVRLVSRAGREHTGRFPGLVAAITTLAPSTVVLDAEVCIFGVHARLAAPHSS